MTAKRVLILTITALAAGVAGYSLLGLRAPKQLASPQTAALASSGEQTIIAVGPDGTLYAFAVPSGGAGTSRPAQGTRTPNDSLRQRGEIEENDDGVRYPYRHD